MSMKKVDKLALLTASTTYQVCKSRHDMPHHYEVLRRVNGVNEDLFYVTLKMSDDSIMPKVIWCDCPGFKGQKFAHIDHKHIKLVRHYQALGEPGWATYRIHGTGAHTEIEFIAQSSPSTPTEE